ncbi:SCO family protein [Neptunomonas antarctica]|uniref:Protein SCO1/2 n=1 Tax=Neptunomonas antarctica TaxID=619304 RepID=A0A1N7KDV6_9GAMM|nr:SCO family protein [Neptunomonas antarctica]SIS59797.1 protein SCO1/2 [Neptunomonas antarctica]
MKKSTLSTLRILLILTLLMLISLAVIFSLRPQAINSSNSSTLGGDFTLQSSQGPVSLSDYRGKVVALYIGYASCPDVCPTALAVITQAFKSLETEEKLQVAGLFISVDPDRDTPEKLATYTRFFSPMITGLTADKASLDKVVRQYGAFYRKVEMEDSAMGYAVDHSSRIYLIDTAGKLYKPLLHNSSPVQLMTEIRTLLNQS